MKYLKTYENINGITFKEWLKKNPKDIYVEYMNCSCSYLIDLNGIEEFINLKVLDCGDNKLTELPDLSNLKNLRLLYCSNNNLTELPDLSNLTKLNSLYCHHNKLTELPDLSSIKQLAYLICHGNNLPFECINNNSNLEEYLEWHKKEYPWIYDAKKYNL